MFQWSQPPADDESDLLQLDGDLPPAFPEAQVLPQPSLLEDASLLDESFAAIGMQSQHRLDEYFAPMSVVALDGAAEAVRMAEAAEVAAAEEALPLSFPPVDEVPQVYNVPSTLERPAPLIAELLAAVGDPNNLTTMAAQLASVETQLQCHRRGPRAPYELPGAGHVFGFDVYTQLAIADLSQWQLSTHEIGDKPLDTAEFVELLVKETSEPDRLGMLHAVLDPLSQAASIQRLLARKLSPDQEGTMPDVQALLAADQGNSHPRNHWLLEGEVDCAQVYMMRGDRDPFRPYIPEAPLRSIQGADMELAGLLGAQCWAAEEDADCQEEVEAKYDTQTVQVAGILQRYMNQSAGENRKMTLDDLIPPSTTDKEVAARTFLAVLTLATAGDLCAEQMQAFGPITLSAP